MGFKGQSFLLVLKSSSAESANLRKIQLLEQKRTGEQENLCNFPAMQYSLPYSAKFEQGMLFT
jgi:hypothetical protein